MTAFAARPTKDGATCKENTTTNNTPTSRTDHFTPQPQKRSLSSPTANNKWNVRSWSFLPSPFLYTPSFLNEQISSESPLDRRIRLRQIYEAVSKSATARQHSAALPPPSPRLSRLFDLASMHSIACSTLGTWLIMQKLAQLHDIPNIKIINYGIGKLFNFS
jgi:hypothetical protein